MGNATREDRLPGRVSAVHDVRECHKLCPYAVHRPGNFFRVHKSVRADAKGLQVCTLDDVDDVPGGRVLVTRGSTRAGVDVRLVHCLHFQRFGLCRRGAGCNFVHVLPEAPVSTCTRRQSYDEDSFKSDELQTISSTTAPKDTLRCSSQCRWFRHNPYATFRIGESTTFWMYHPPSCATPLTCTPHSGRAPTSQGGAGNSADTPNRID